MTSDGLTRPTRAKYAEFLRADIVRLEGLDPGIADHVNLLREHGVETFESCDGSPGHSYAEPTVRFFGQRDEGFRALAVALEHGIPVSSIRRYWDIVDGEPCGPDWEMTFRSVAPSDVEQERLTLRQSADEIAAAWDRQRDADREPAPSDEPTQETGVPTQLLEFCRTVMIKAVHDRDKLLMRAMARGRDDVPQEEAPIETPSELAHETPSPTDPAEPAVTGESAGSDRPAPSGVPRKKRAESRLLVLDALAIRPMTPPELVAETGIPTGSLYNLLMTMIPSELIRRQSDDGIGFIYQLRTP